VVHRTARIGLRLTRAQRRRCFGLLAAHGSVGQRRPAPPTGGESLARTRGEDPQRTPQTGRTL